MSNGCKTRSTARQTNRSNDSPTRSAWKFLPRRCFLISLNESHHLFLLTAPERDSLELGQPLVSRDLSAIGDRHAPFLVAAALAAFFVAPAQAQIVCGDRDKLVANLLGKHNERLVSRGLDFRRHMVEIFASPDGSWTMTLTAPGRPTCVIGHGEDWRQLNPDQVKGDPA